MYEKIRNKYTILIGATNIDENYGTLVINNKNINHYHSCTDEEYNAEYLNGIGFSMETAIKIAAWAYCTVEGAEYEQDELTDFRIYVI